MSSFAHILRTRNIQKQGRLYLGNATASRYKGKHTSKRGIPKWEKIKICKHKAIEMVGRKEGRGDCGSMQTMFYRADIFLPAQDSDETIIIRCRCCVQFNCSCISNQPREKVLISLEKTFQASSLQIGCNNSKNLDLTSDPPGFRRASFVNIADRFPITLENPTFSNNFPDIALPKKSFGVCQLRRAFQLLSQPGFSPASFSNGPSSICALGKFSNNLSLKCGLNSPNNLSTKSSIISHPNFPNNILSVSSLDRTQTFKLSWNMKILT